MKRTWRDGWQKDLNRPCLRCGKEVEGGPFGRNGRLIYRCRDEAGGCGLCWTSAGKMSTVEYVFFLDGAWRWRKTPKGLLAVFGEVA